MTGNGHAGGPGYKAQNNTLAVFTDPDTIARFTAELVAEHLVAVSQGGRLGVKKKAAPAKKPPAGKKPATGKKPAAAKKASATKATTARKTAKKAASAPRRSAKSR